MAYYSSMRRETVILRWRLQARNHGFLLTGLLGEQESVPGEVKTIDFMDNHSAVLGVDIKKH
jgi:predicted RNA-binding protein